MTTNPQAPGLQAIDERKYLETLYQIFDQFVLDDQRKYYMSNVDRNRTAASQVNRIRAGLALLTGLSSALAGLLIQSYIDGSSGQCTQTGLPLGANCGTLQVMVIICMAGAILMPAIGSAFNILSDLYQWDRLITMYDTALENIEVADAQSPDPEMDLDTYRLALRAFTEGTLGVMSDETAQWGQLIRPPVQIEDFLKQEQNRAEQASKLPLGNQRTTLAGSAQSSPPQTLQTPSSDPPAAG